MHAKEVCMVPLCTHIECCGLHSNACLSVFEFYHHQQQRIKTYACCNFYIAERDFDFHMQLTVHKLSVKRHNSLYRIVVKTKHLLR
jgi:hypothetical protein